MSVHFPSRPGAPTVARCLSLIAFAGSCLTWCLAGAQTMVTGKVSGEFATSPSGAATYRIPIGVPPGVSGMEPKLALSYNSQAGNGIMGVGWGIDGLSVITRCSKTLVTDGVRGGINNDVEDRFCLDGQRLINIAGSYGAAGSEYRTEIESFSKVTAVGAAGGNSANGPERFTVKTKAGLTMEYGGTADSRIEVQGGNLVRVWALNKTTDASGNLIEFFYAENNAIGQYQVSNVNYAGRSVHFTYEDRPDKFHGYQAGTKISQTERLREVETRLGLNTLLRTKISYSADSSLYGSFASSIQVCDRDENCFAPSTIDYRVIGLNQQIHLDAPRNDWAFILPNINTYNPPNHLVLDYDGDGISDILSVLTVSADHALTCSDSCVMHPAPIVYYLHKGLGTGSYSTAAANDVFGINANTGPTGFVSRYFNIAAGNVNADEYSDLIGYEIGYQGIKTSVAISNGSNFVHKPMQVHASSGYGLGWKIMGIDIKGSGRSDLIAYYVGSSGVYTQSLISNGLGGFAMQGLQSHSASNYTDWQLSPIDMNGDGHMDLLLRYIGVAGIKAQLLLGNGAGAFTIMPQMSLSTGNYTDWSLLSVDVNGDRSQDVVAFYLSDATFNVKTFIHKGDGNFVDVPGSAYSIGAAPQYSSGWRVLMTDINADGRDDFVAVYSRMNGHYLGEFGLRPLMADGAGGFTLRDLKLLSNFSAVEFSGYTNGSLQIQAVSNPGNGSNHLLTTTLSNTCEGPDPEFCTPVTNAQARTLMNLDGSKLATRFSDGSSTTDVVHEPLTKLGLHVLDGVATYPLTNLSLPLQVVSSVARSNGVGGVSATTYGYGGLKAEHTSAQHPGSGRGMLGFRWMKSSEAATGIVVTTEFSQSWPTIGQVVKSETRRAGSGNGGLLKQTTATYGCYQSHAGAGGAAPAGPTAACGAWAAGKVYLPIFSTSIEDSWDLNGTAMPRISTANTYGGYADQGGVVRQFGDPTQVQVDIHLGGQLKHRKTTVNEFHPAKTGGADWQLGRLKRAAVTSTQY